MNKTTQPFTEILLLCHFRELGHALTCLNKPNKYYKVQLMLPWISNCKQKGTLYFK